jgi:hypothetical protein
LAALPAQEAVTVAHELASGKVTIAALQAPPVVAAPSEDGSLSNDNLSDEGTSSAEAQPAAGVLPQVITALWQPYANNGVAVAAGVVVLLLVVVGVALALRRELTDPPL